MFKTCLYLNLKYFIAKRNVNHHLSLQPAMIFLLVESLKYCKNYQNVTQTHELIKQILLEIQSWTDLFHAGLPQTFICLEKKKVSTNIIKWSTIKWGMLVFTQKLLQDVKRKNEILTHVTTRMDLENIVKSERSQTQKTTIVWLHLNEMSRIGKFIETESKLLVTRREKGNGEWHLMGMEFPSGIMKMS